MNAEPPDKLKLYALLACLVLFLACCGLGGFLMYHKYSRTRPQPSAQPQPVDITNELKSAHGKGKEVYQLAKQASDQEELETALAKFKEAKEIWQSAAEKLDEVTQKSEYQDDRYKGWQDIASQLETDLVVVKDDIFETEMRLSRKKNAKAASKSSDVPEQ